MEPKPLSAYAARGGAANALRKVRYSHDAMIDAIIENPTVSQNELANSDAFRERLAERKDELVDPRIRMSVEERIRGLADKSIEVLLEKLHETRNMNVAVRALDVAARSLGYGARASAAVQINNYVAHIPPRAADAATWVEGYASSGPETSRQP